MSESSGDIALSPTHVAACIQLVTVVLRNKSMGQTERERWLGCLDALNGRARARPAPFGQKAINLLTAAMSGDRLSLDRAVAQLRSVLIEHGEAKAADDLKRAAAMAERPILARLMDQATGGGDGKGNASSGGPATSDLASDRSDTRTLEWFEDPKTFAEDFVIDARTGPELERLIDDLKGSARFIAQGIDAPTRALFVGPPGVGKTTAAGYVAGQLGLKLAVGRLDGIVSPLIGQTAKNLRGLFEEAIDDRCVLFLDEFDAVGPRRDASNTHESQKQITSALFQQLDLLPKAQIVIGATNLMEKLDPSLRRRIPTQIQFYNPDPGGRATLLARWWKKVPALDEARMLLVDETEGRSGDHLRFCAMRAARTALKDGGTIRPDHVLEALIAAPTVGALGDGAAA